MNSDREREREMSYSMVVWEFWSSKEENPEIVTRSRTSERAIWRPLQAPWHMFYPGRWHVRSCTNFVPTRKILCTLCICSTERQRANGTKRAYKEVKIDRFWPRILLDIEIGWLVYVRKALGEKKRGGLYQFRPHSPPLPFYLPPSLSP